MSPIRLTAAASSAKTGRKIVGGYDVEARSWEPSGGGSMKMDPMPLKPTNRDIGDRLVQVHDCLEGHKRGNDAHFRKLSGEITEVKAEIDQFKQSFGLQPGQRPAAGTSSPWQAWRRTLFATTTAVTSVAVIYKVGLAIGPGVWEAIKALLHAAAHGLI